MIKNITIIGINFYPEDTSTGLYTTGLAEFLNENGYNVSVITGFPYYPQWEIREDYRKRSDYLIEDFKGIKIFRYRQFTPKNPSFLKRVKHIASFTSGSLKNIKKIKKSDLVIAIVPFTSDIWLAHKLARKTKAKVWVHIQDFEFDAAFESGIIKNKIIEKVMRGILNFVEKRLLNKADIVSTISFSMMEKAKKKTKTELFYFPNWIEDDFINPEKAKKHPYLEEDKFNILYSGNIGAKQDWDRFLEFVNHFESREDINIVVVGDGAKKEWLVSKIKNKKNVKYFPPVSYEELPDLLCSADLHILFQKESVVDTVMPSKLLGMMASAKPSLIVGNSKSEVAKIVNESKGGEFLEHPKMEEIESFVNKLINNRKLVEDYGKSAREYIVKNFSKEKVLGKLVDRIKFF